MRAAIDADFNADSRALSVKLEIYFDGPLTVSKDDYLIDASWLEEGSAESTNPFGAVSSNELSFRLYNENGMFSPTNTSSPYFGKIKPGVLVVPFIRPEDTDEEVEWEKLGEYYVTGWDAAITGTYADITANDKWQDIFSSAAPNYPVERNVTHKQSFDNIFSLMGHEVLVSEGLNKLLLFSFIEGTPLNFIEEIATGAIAFCTCNKQGTPIIEPFIKDREVRAVLTDSNQIKTVMANQSITKAYDGVEFTYGIPQISEQDKLVDLQKLEVPVGISALNNIAFGKGPVWRLKYITVDSTLNEVKLAGCTSSPWLLNVLLDNTHTEPNIIGLSAYGTTLLFTDIVLADSVSKLLQVNSRYVQEAEYAQQYKAILEAFVNNAVPTLSLSIRGNPLLNIGDRVIVQSTKYQLNYDGVIQRLSYSYVGGLSCEMTLLNNALLQEVL